MDTGLGIAALNLDLGISAARKVAGSGNVAAAKSAEQPSFADAVKDAGMNVVNSVQKAEAASIAGIKGEASTYEVASSMMEAEQNLRMTIAIRDKFVQSYMEISRMQI